MPLYEYQCQSCEERLEAIQKFSEPPYTRCPKCGGDLKKLISSPAIQFKGSGFYITDYARAGSSGDKSGGSSDKSGGSEGSTSEGSSAKKGDDSK